jgi:chemotaxis-related protein WspB
MLLLTFHAGSQCFGIEASSIIEVAMVPSCRRVPLAPQYFFGLCHYRGATIPVLDLTFLLAGTASRLMFSTRLVVVRVAIASGSPQTLGLVAEDAVQTLRCALEDVADPEVRIKRAPYLGETVISKGLMIQMLSVPILMETEVAEVLFAAV